MENNVQSRIFKNYNKIAFSTKVIFAIKYLVATLVLIVLQNTVFSQLSIFGSVANLAIAFLAVGALFSDLSITNNIALLICAFVYDLSELNGIFLCTGGIFLMILTLALLKNFGLKGNFLTSAFVVGFFTILYELVCFLTLNRASAVVSQNGIWYTLQIGLKSIVFFELFYNVLFSLLFCSIIKKFFKLQKHKKG